LLKRQDDELPAQTGKENGRPIRMIADLDRNDITRAEGAEL